MGVLVQRFMCARLFTGFEVHPGNARFVLEKVDMLPFHWVTQKHPPRGKDMSTSLLYHGFGLVGYRQVNQSFEGSKVTFRVEQPRERHRCSACERLTWRSIFSPRNSSTNGSLISSSAVTVSFGDFSRPRSIIAALLCDSLARHGEAYLRHVARCAGNRPSRRSRPSRMVIGCGGQPGT